MRGQNRLAQNQVIWNRRVIKVNRVTKVVKGGKLMSFRAIVAVGNSKGQVGVGVGKGKNFTSAIENGQTDARKHIIRVPLTNASSIPHLITGYYGAAQLLLRPSPKGSGVLAGGASRIILELAGVKNILAKQLGSKNLLNNARATIEGLRNLQSYK